MTDYTELVKELRRYSMLVIEPLHTELAKAADAIEELSDNRCIHFHRNKHDRGDDSYCDYYNCEARALPRWIPVTERLPKHLTSVIVHRKDGGIFIWEYFDTSPTDECWIDDSMDVYSFYDVTHWMPLPEPPKEET